MNLMQKMMFKVYQSELGFDETIKELTESAKKNGWEIPMVYDLQEGYQESGYEDMTKIKIIYFCNPSGGFKILQDDENKPMSVMMPMGVSVYETQAGQVFISGMNLERMSMMFGGTVKDVLREGAVNYDKTLDDFAQPEACSAEIKAQGGRCCLGCVSMAAILAALLGVLVWIGSKILPALMTKMMSRMMPKIMDKMEEADVKPPCAHIILDHLETEN